MTAVLSLALVSAADLVQITKGSDLTRNVNVSNFKIKNIYTDNINFSMLSPDLRVSDGKGHFATLTLSPSSLSLNDFPKNNETTISVSLTVDSSFVIKPEIYTFPAITINAVSSLDSLVKESENLTFSFTQNYCKYGEIGDIEITKLTDENLDNEDDWEWYSSDNIELTTRLSNSVGDDLDFVIEYGLYDTTDKKFIDINEDTIDLSVDDGSSEEATITFQVPSDSSEIDASHSYKFYVKAYEDGNEKAICAERVADENVDIKQESNSVVLNSIEIPTSASCSENIELRAKVINNGVSDQKRALVRAYNKELGMDLKKVFEKLNSGDEEIVTFDFIIPANMTDKVYTIEFTTLFRYDGSNSGCIKDEDLSCYDRNSFDDLDKTYRELLKLEGCKPVAPVVTDNAQITATLESEAVAGKEIVVRATIKNIGSSTAVYQVLVSGYDAFATLSKEVTPSLVTLDAGKSQDVLIYLKANSDASGDYTFNIKALSGTKIKEQPVSLSITPKTSAFGNLNIFGSLQANWFIWVIVLINVVLIILIIVVAVRIARK